MYRHPEDLVTISYVDSVAILTMNEPKRRNPFSQKMREALRDAFTYLQFEDSRCRVIVLTGAGGNYCAGGDLSEMTTSPSITFLRNRLAFAASLVRLIYKGPKIVISAVEGACIGAGLSLACASDFVVSDPKAKFSSAFVKVGLLPDTGLLWTLAEKVGDAKARELMMTGEMFEGESALEYGVVSELSEGSGLIDRAVAIAQEFASKPPITLSLLKGSLSNSADSIENAWSAEVDLNPIVRITEDHQEAVNAFMEKRRPEFVGR